ncbi:MAG: DUF2807 domain-containing protein [Chitinophagaceae bacterium]|jgi:hypothetical protein|nr:DUF2807 domain-containing protein [Chitinophagaceae bacterium]
MKILLQAILVLILGTGSVGAQKTIIDEFAQVRQAGKFEAISINGAFEVILTQADEQAVVVSASNEMLRDMIETDVRDATLFVGLKKSNFDWRGGRKFRVYISVPVLKRIEIGGYSKFSIENGLKADNLDITISGSSDFSGNISSKALKLHSSGSSDFRLSGKSERLSVVVSGTSDVRGYDLQVDYCEINASGNSMIEITLEKEMTVNVSGGSKVYYKGKGMVKEFNASGKASLHKLE